MSKSRLSLFALVIAAALPLQGQALAPDSAVKRILQERLGASPFRGIVVGLLDADGRRRVVAGGGSQDRAFRIGSVTKTFTASIPAAMLADGPGRLDDPL